MVQLPIDHSFIPQQFVKFFFLWQEEMIRQVVHFRVARWCGLRICQIVCRRLLEIVTMPGKSPGNLTALPTYVHEKLQRSYGGIIYYMYFEPAIRLIVYVYS